MPRNANQSKQSNYSIDFTASDKISLGSSVDLGINSSVSLWINMSNTPTIYIPLGEDSYLADYLMYVSSTLIYIVIGNVYKTYTHSFNTNQWYHIVIVRQGDSIEVFKDNTSLGTQTGFGTSVTTKIDTIGAKTNGNNTFIGLIDAVAFFDYALSSSQITTLYGTGSAIGNPMALPSPPIAYYPLGTSAWNGQYLAENNAIGDYVFDFSNDLIDSNFTLTTGQTQFSASIWVKFTGSLGSDESLIANESSYAGDGFAIFKNTSNQIVFKCEGQTAVGTTTVALNKWYLATVTYNAGAMVLYVNGQQEATQTTATSITQPSTPKTRLGKYITAGAIPFTGELSNAQIWDSKLEASEAQTLYNYGSPIRTLANIPQSSNLKAWYKLDASEVYNNTTTEWSIDNNKYPSTYNSSINLVRASSQKIDIANGSELDFTEDFTMSIWVNLTTSNNNMGIFNKTSQANGNGVTLFKRGGANFEFYVSEYSNVLTFASQGDNIWQQITITLNRTTGERVAYINGEQAATLTHIKTFAFPNQGWDIGTFATNSPNYLDAKVSNFKLFNTVLSPTEVQTLYNNGTPLTDMSSFTSLKGWWKLNNLSSGLTDSSSNSNNATISISATDYAGFVNTQAGDSSGMSQANLVQSDLQTVAPYSKYALDFDGTDDLITISNESNFDFDRTDSFSISCWFKCDDVSLNNHIINKLNATGDYTGYNLFINNTDSKLWFYLRHDYTSPNQIIIKSDSALVSNVWYNLVVTYDGSSTAAGCKMYIDNVNVSTTQSDTLSSSILNNQPLRIGGRSPLTTNFANGSISNVSVWNTALTVSQVSEIYNEGLPGNLNFHSAYSNLVSWWQLGENSSFNGNDWICADEKGTNNGSSTGMPVGALVNGVGTTANGTSTGMSEGSLVGNAPYSTANAISINMSATARGTNVP